MNMENCKFKGLFLDLDGTLINSAPMMHEIMKEIFQKYNLGSVSESMMTKFAGLPAKLFFDSLDHVNKDDFLKDIVTLEKKYRSLAPSYPEVTELISTISDKGLPLAVISSQAGLEMDLVKISYDFAPRIDFWLSADDVQKHKPDPEGIYIALNHFDIPAKNILFVGDTVYDIQAGKSAGVSTGAALWGGHNQDLLTTSNPDFTFTKPFQILTHFGL